MFCLGLDTITTWLGSGKHDGFWFKNTCFGHDDVRMKSVRLPVENIWSELRSGRLAALSTWDNTTTFRSTSWCKRWASECIMWTWDVKFGTKQTLDVPVVFTCIISRWLLDNSLHQLQILRWVWRHSFLMSNLALFPSLRCLFGVKYRSVLFFFLKKRYWMFWWVRSLFRSWTGQIFSRLFLESIFSSLWGTNSSVSTSFFFFQIRQ